MVEAGPEAKRKVTETPPIPLLRRPLGVTASELSSQGWLFLLE